MRRGSISVGIAFVALALAACGGTSSSGTGGGGSGSACPNDLPAKCTTAPSYKSDVAPIIERHCQPCHAPGAEEAVMPFVTYGEVHDDASAVLDQVYACRMPNKGDTTVSAAVQKQLPLSTSERQTLLLWLICNSPDN
jgi:hypothetical protein